MTAGALRFVRNPIWCVVLSIAMVEPTGREALVAAEFELRLETVDVVHADELLDLAVRLVEAELSPEEPGASGWQFGVAHSGVSILEATIAGSTAEPFIDGGFESTEITTGEGNDGFVSAVVLSLARPATLPRGLAPTIARARYRVRRAGCVDGVAFEVRDDLVGSGSPVRTVISHQGRGIPPRSERIAWERCLPNSYRFRVAVEGADDEGRVRLSSAPEPGIRARLEFSQAAPSASAWTIAVGHDDAVLSIEGAALDTAGLGALLASDGFSLIEITRGLGNAGVVASIELSASGRESLPVTTSSALIIDYRVREPIGPDESRSTVIEFPDSLRGSSGPIENSVRPSGELEVHPTRWTLLGSQPPRFLRSDSNDDGTIDIRDPIATLHVLFLGRGRVCLDAANANGDSGLDVTDVIFSLEHIFRGGSAPPAPFPACAPAVDGEGCRGARC
jgi:hypothetical protein